MRSCLAVLILLLLGAILCACESEPKEPVAPEAESSQPAAAVSETNTPLPMPTASPAPVSTLTPVPTATAAPFVPQFEAADCQFSPSNISYVSCGYVTVPENREAVDGNEISLHVAVAKSFAGEPEKDPLIFLSGGPGSFALEWLYWNMPNYTDILRNRDIIFFDPRGVGFSEPSLDCPEVVEAFHETLDRQQVEGELVNNLVEANFACRERLVEQGIDLQGYNSIEMAADVNDIRRALGYDQVNLFGVSYGTRTALTVMRDYPEILRSVVLDSPLPLEVNIFGAEAATSDQARQRLFERCQSETYCSSAYPDLDGALDRLFEKLNDEPITIPVRHLGTNEIYQVWVDGSILGASIFEALYNNETLITIPKLIYDTLEAEDYEALATSLEIYLFYGDYASEGMRHSVLCADEGSFSTPEEGLSRAENAHPSIAAYIKKDVDTVQRICEAWGMDPADPIENQPVTSDIPTLVLSGEFDPVTPLAYAQQAANNLSNSFLVEFPNLGHYVFSERSCARDITADFLVDPHSKPDSNCVNFITLNFLTY